jgi:type I restriction enzyme S subunit
MTNSKDNKTKAPNVPPLRFPGFADEWKKTTLGDISVSISSGKSGNPIEDGDYYLYGSTGIIGLTDNGDYDGEKILVARVGANAGRINYNNCRCGITDNTLIIRIKEYSTKFIYFYLIHSNLNRLVFGSGQPLITGGMLKKLSIGLPSSKECDKIVSLLNCIEERIATQNKIIEDLKKLKSAIIDGHFNGLKANCRIGELIYVISQRNRRQESLPVLSVSNRSGFIAQSEQFGNRTIASEDTSNYKIVITNDFAFNPARINVGSIARLINYKRGIVSPMYICFRCKEGISSEYLDLFFKSRYFQTEVGKRLEGSVRQCLSIDGIKSIPIERIPMSQQIKWTKRLTTIETKITIEENIYQLYKLQRNYLLSKMFI